MGQLPWSSDADDGTVAPLDISKPSPGYRSKVDNHFFVFVFVLVLSSLLLIYMHVFSLFTFFCSF
jgi:hypothetical protein